jgi:hypothetical protein
MIYERKYNLQLERYLLYFPVAGIIGPRQVGKTTFVKEFLRKHKGQSLYLDLELNSDIIKLQDPEIFLKEHSDKLVVIDEVQHRRDLFPLLRALIDQDYRAGRFILLGSAVPDLIRDSSESLAGRIMYPARLLIRKRSGLMGDFQDHYSLRIPPWLMIGCRVLLEHILIRTCLYWVFLSCRRYHPGYGPCWHI